MKIKLTIFFFLSLLSRTSFATIFEVLNCELTVPDGSVFIVREEGYISVSSYMEGWAIDIRRFSDYSWGDGRKSELIDYNNFSKLEIRTIKSRQNSGLVVQITDRKSVVSFSGSGARIWRKFLSNCK